MSITHIAQKTTVSLCFPSQFIITTKIEGFFSVYGLKSRNITKIYILLKRQKPILVIFLLSFAILVYPLVLIITNNTCTLESLNKFLNNEGVSVLKIVSFFQ